ncbi:hypothetical protein G3N55_00830 [Dissulfurirhabdus thermomarina]|uniref:DUF2229 domain-containing protein n=1 Tax=Dissulfurirhabdus thermomarina TaxID=1765737 RepID=A0A6N9TS49_DISTH|nr:acyl-CoA dehydratase activase-related protein [Dissulfurirhabdus thermomarina]NDY41396.1 hypothetical protein [Dissulfurirhabdus thermomarina]NMX23588.1 hypothetical protein [Dissulfurirhabdus thermomarina]
MIVGLPGELLGFPWARELERRLEAAFPGARIRRAPARAPAAPPLSEGDACYPYKRMIRSALGLLAESDALVLPRLLRLDGHLMCPNFRALPDIVALNWRRLHGEEPPMAAPAVEVADGRDAEAAFEAVIRELRRLPGGRRAEAARAQPPRPAPGTAPPRAEDGRRRAIALVGHPYILSTPALHKGVPDLVRRAGFRVVTPEGLPFRTLDRLARDRDYYAKVLYWRGARECLGAFRHFTEVRPAAGLIYLIAFNCGVDALLRLELAALHKDLARRVPFMVLVVDEHTQHEHVATRVEAFLDIVDGTAHA